MLLDIQRPCLFAVVYNRPRIPAVPLVVLTTSNRSEKEEDDWLPVARYIEEGLISQVLVLNVTPDIFDAANVEALTTALEFLVEKAPPSPVQHLGTAAFNVRSYL